MDRGELIFTVWMALRRAQGRLPIQTLQEARDSITSIAIPPASAGCAEIITGCVDGVVRSYDVRMGKLVGDTIGGTFPLTSSRDTCIRADSG